MLAGDDFDLPQESLDKYLPLFAKNRAADLEKIHQCLGDSDFSAVSALAHKIKGTAAAFGHAPLGQMAAELEKEAQSCRLEPCERILAQLKSYFVSHLSAHMTAGNS